jgi:hypothetical protein
VELEWIEKIENFLDTRSDEERAYVKQIFPTLLETIKESCSLYPSPTMNGKLMETIIHHLICGKQIVAGVEGKLVQKMVDKEVQEIKEQRPNRRIKQENLGENKRKTKKSIKGHKNNSSLNHINENYVSNIFQFAKQNHPEDKEIHAIANTRNVSASNFRKLTHMKMDDSLLVRKAKVRILGSGKELVSNIEYWMNDGYFGQCQEKEKYIANKDKALTDLVLDGQN